MQSSNMIGAPFLVGSRDSVILHDCWAELPVPRGAKLMDTNPFLKTILIFFNFLKQFFEKLN